MRKTDPTPADTHSPDDGPTAVPACVLMVRPAHFGYDEAAADDNAFMRPARRLSARDIELRAREEFAAMLAALREAGIEVIVIDDSDTPAKPDAVFPNNWFSTHANGTVVTYPMRPPPRRPERLNGVVEELERRFAVARRISLEPFEQSEQFLEGTGSLVLDRVARVAYACRSLRTDEEVVTRWAELMDYELVLFDARDAEGLPIYHTNVMLAVGLTEAIVCGKSIPADQREDVLARLRTTGRELIEIDLEQVGRFCGNALELRDGRGQRRWVMSSQAYSGFTAAQAGRLALRGSIVHASLEAIEQLGGGSARCMIAEVILPQGASPTGVTAAR